MLFLREETPNEKPIAPCVLLVDDDPMVRTLLATSLKHLGCRILTAANGEEALEILKTQPSVDAVVTEAAMPVMGGLELLRAVRQTDGLKQLPVILCSAAIDEATKKNAVKYGCSSYLSKPVHPELLFEQISSLLQEEVSSRDVQPAQA